jgi:DNA-binding transcriptional ArsR family regulator
MQKNIKNIKKATNLLKMISNENRLMMLCLLNQKELSVNNLVASIGLSQSAISQHLALLRKENLVKTRRENQTIYYSLYSEEIKDIIKVLHKHYCSCN